MSIEKYALNYGWGHQPGWTEDTEITLLGRVGGSVAAAVVRAWVQALPESDVPREAGRHYHGGATLELQPGDADTGGLVVAIRSSGQDAFDSVAWYARVVGNLVSAVVDADGEGDETSLSWTEVPVGDR